MQITAATFVWQTQRSKCTTGLLGDGFLTCYRSTGQDPHLSQQHFPFTADVNCAAGTGLVPFKVTWSPVWSVLRQLGSIPQTLTEPPHARRSVCSRLWEPLWCWDNSTPPLGSAGCLPAASGHNLHPNWLPPSSEILGIELPWKPKQI